MLVVVSRTVMKPQGMNHAADDVSRRPGIVAANPLQGTGGRLLHSKVLIREGIGERFDYGGGASDLGTVFKIDPSGELTTLQSFREPDGRTPMAALIEATDGDFYGTTEGIFNFP